VHRERQLELIEDVLERRGFKPTVELVSPPRLTVHRMQTHSTCWPVSRTALIISAGPFSNILGRSGE